MFRRLVLLCLFLLLAAHAFAYSFAIFGDCQGNYGVLKVLVNKLQQEKGLDFVVSVGDVVPYGEEANYIKYKKIMSAIKLPLYQAPGNHDTVNGG